MKKILMVIARKDFRDEEYFIPRELFQRAGIETVTASSKTGTLIGALGGEAEATLALEAACAEDFDALMFVGGSGSVEYFQSEKAHQLAQAFNQADKLVAAICIAPVILANAGLLQGKTGTVWRSALDKTGPQALAAGGCSLSENHVERAGSIITADGREAAEEFARAIIAQLDENRS